MIYLPGTLPKERLLLHGHLEKRTQSPRPVRPDFRYCGNDPLLLPGVGNAAGAGLDERAHSYTYQYLYPHGDLYPRAAHGYSCAANRYSDYYSDSNADFYPFPHLHPLPDTYSHAYRDDYYRAADADINRYPATSAADGHIYPCAAYSDTHPGAHPHADGYDCPGAAHDSNHALIRDTNTSFLSSDILKLSSIIVLWIPKPFSNN